jgi:hypothetical protein
MASKNAVNEIRNTNDDIQILTDKPSGSWIVDPETGTWTPADEATIKRYGKDAVYVENRE